MWTDAVSLHQSNRLGTADHLYGLAAECALKAILVGLTVIPAAGPPKNSPFRVHINKLWDEFNIYISGQGHGAYMMISTTPFIAWSVEQRYDEDSTFTIARIGKHAQAAREAYQIFQQSILDGVI